MNVCEAHACCRFTLLLIHAGGSVLPLRRNLVKEKEGVWRWRIYRKYASCKWLKNAGLEFTRADVVLSISRGPPGQWFPEIEYWASAIFVGTSGIPPKIIYRSVKSYNFILLLLLFYYSFLGWYIITIISGVILLYHIIVAIFISAFFFHL